MPGSTARIERYRDRELTLEELVAAAARALRQFGLRPEDGRVAEEIDARGIRYYQTIGIIDRPLRYDGRRAIYGYRHLLQLLAVKQLQQEGHPLQLIQQALAGRSTQRLERALGRPEPGTCDPRCPPRSGIAAADLAAPDKPERDGAGTDDRFHGDSGLPAEKVDSPRLVAALVAPGITMIVDRSEVPDAEEVIESVLRYLSAARRS